MRQNDTFRVFVQSRLSDDTEAPSYRTVCGSDDLWAPQNPTGSPMRSLYPSVAPVYQYQRDQTMAPANAIHDLVVFMTAGEGILRIKRLTMKIGHAVGQIECSGQIQRACAAI